MSIAPPTIASLIAKVPQRECAEWQAALEADRAQVRADESAAVTKRLSEDHGRAIGKANAELASERREKAKANEQLAREQDAHRRTELRARALDGQVAELERDVSKRDRQIEQQGASLKAKDQVIADMTLTHASELAAKNKRIAELEMWNGIWALGTGLSTTAALIKHRRRF